MCGIRHVAVAKDCIACIKGMRQGKPCVKVDCVFRHPGDKIPKIGLDEEHEGSESLSVQDDKIDSPTKFVAS